MYVYGGIRSKLASGITKLEVVVLQEILNLNPEPLSVLGLGL